jgi:antibiotic biosynthesis monooxygenase (ABM) superfamily enzyme
LAAPPAAWLEYVSSTEQFIEAARHHGLTLWMQKTGPPKLSVALTRKHNM